MQPSGLRDTTRLLPGLKSGVSDVEKSMKTMKFLAVTSMSMMVKP